MEFIKGWIDTAISFFHLRRRDSDSENKPQTVMKAENINITAYYNTGPGEKNSMEGISSTTIDCIEVMSQEAFKALPEKKDRTLYITF